MNCPKCQTKLEWRNPGGKANNLTKRAGVDVLKLKCGSCNEKWLCDDAAQSHPYQTHPNRLTGDDVTRVYSIRLSLRQLKSVEKGNCLLTISGNRLQLQYKT